MSVTSKPIIASQYAAATETTEYTATGVRTIIDKFTAYNSSAAVVAVTVKLVAAGDSASAEEVIETKGVPAGETWGFPYIVGHALEPGGIISVLAGTAGVVVIRATAREVT
jgi:hypothetical protein